MSSFHLQIVTPDGSFFDGEANSVVVRTTGGYVSIYPHHTDYIAALDIGRVVVTKDGEPRHAACGGGFLSVEKGEVLFYSAAAVPSAVFSHLPESDCAFLRTSSMVPTLKKALSGNSSASPSTIAAKLRIVSLSGT